ncbi:MAG TPA: efflux RND transporter permease subunit [Vicinamibacterales bacterium]|nr:efflux RND transporter permease subunit [Vicinamibacterales bacterium]
MSIPRIAIQRPITMFMLSATVVLLGVMSLARLPVDLLPDVSYPSLTVRVGYAGVGPLEIEELVVRPLEQAMAAVPGVEVISATASEGSGMVRLNFAWGTDLNEAADEVRTRVDRIRGRLPEEADPPTIFKFDSNASPIMGIGVEGDFDRVTLRELATNDLSPRIERVPGVAAVTVDGGLRRQIKVDLSKEKITALNLSVDRVTSVLRSENQNVPLGEVDEGDTTYLVRSAGQFQNLEDIRNLVILTTNGVPVYLRDIAEVYDGTEDFRSFTRINGKPGVRMRVTKQSGTNTVQIAEAVKAEVARINDSVNGMRLAVLDDQSIFIDRSIDSVKEHALIGSVLVILIIFLFLRDLRSTFIISLSIPISVIGTFALLYFAGYTLNTMTFGGLALGVGMIVDASIVVLENTYRHMEMGKDRVTASIDGSEEVWSAILASTLTHIAVFIPLLFLTGVSSILFKQLAIVVMFSLLMSLFVAVTIVPVLCAKLLRLPSEAHARTGLAGRLFNSTEVVLDRVDDGYKSFLHRSLHHRPMVLGVSAALVAAAVLLLPTLSFELMPQADEGQVRIDLDMPVGSRIERTEAVVLRVEEMALRAVPEALMIISSAGGGGFMGGGSNRANIELRLVPKTERDRSSEDIAADLRRELTGVAGAVIRTRASGGNSQMNRILGGLSDARLSLEIRGHDLDDATRIAQGARTMMERTEGVTDVRMGREEGRPELAIRVDRPKAALLGLSVSSVANTIRTNVAGTQAAFFRDRGNEYPIIVRLREEDRGAIRDVGDVLVSTPGGRVTPARSILSVESQAGPVQIERKNQERIARVSAETEIALSDAVDRINAQIPSLDIPPDFSVGFGSEVEEQARAFRQLQTMLILAVLLVYGVMASQYESFRDPFIIMFSVPVAAIGVVLMLKLTGTTFSLQAYIGVIMLAGIVVSNAILLVDYTNILRRRDGMALREAVETAGRTRLRPILMTSFATMLGLTPMALGIGEGAELQAPLARVVVGGLMASTLVTLVLVPTVYTLFEEGWAGLRHRAPEPAEAGQA